MTTGFGAGTGSAFSLLPAQNATGNWIKIVQRVPVRVALDPRELAMHPLQIGLSMRAEVDVHNTDGSRLPQLANNAANYSTDVFHSTDKLADGRVQAIIAANTAGTVYGGVERHVAERKPVSAAPTDTSDRDATTLAPDMASSGALLGATRHLN